MTTVEALTRPRLGLYPRHDAGISLLAPVGRRPIDEYDETIAKADQEVDVREQPEEPGEETAELEMPGGRHEIDDRRVPPDGRERAVIAIPERLRVLAAHAVHDVRGGAAPHLLGARRHARHRRGFAAGDMAPGGSEVADHVDVRPVRHRQVGLDDDTPRAVDLRPGGFGKLPAQR